MKKRIISIVMAIALILVLPFQMMQMVGAQTIESLEEAVLAAQNAQEGDYSPEDWQNLQSVLAEALAVKDAEFVTVKATSNGNSGKLLTASDSEYVYLSDLATEPTLNQIWKRVTTSGGFQLINAATGKYLYLSDEVYNEPAYAKFTKQGNIADIDEAATYLEIKENCLAFIKRYNNVTVTMHFNHGNNASQIYTWANTGSDRTCSVDSIETPEALLTDITDRLNAVLLTKLETLEDYINAAKTASKSNYSDAAWAELQAAIEEAENLQCVTVKATSGGNSGKLLTASDSEYVYLSDLSGTPNANQSWKRVTTSQGFQLINAATGKYLYLSDEYQGEGYALYVKQGNIADIDEAATYLEIKDNCLAFIERYNNVTVTMHFNRGDNTSKIYTWANANSDRTCVIEEVTVSETIKEQSIARLKAAMIQHEEIKTLEQVIESARAEDENNYSTEAWNELQAAIKEAEEYLGYVTVKVTTGGNNGKLLTASDSEYVYLSSLSGTPNANQSWKRVTTSEGFQLINAATGKYLYLSDEYQGEGYALYVKQGNIADIDEAATYLEIKDNCLAFKKLYKNVTVVLHFNRGDNTSKIYTWSNPGTDRTCVVEDAPVSETIKEQCIARIEAAMAQRNDNTIVGDANEDGILNICDLVCIYNYINNNESIINLTLADINNDTIVNINDFDVLRSILLEICA